MTTPCARFLPHVGEFAESGAMVPPGRIADHLLACEICRGRLESHRRVLRALEAMPQRTPPREFRATVMARVLKTSPPAPMGAHRRFRAVHLLLLTALGATAGGTGVGALIRGSWISTGLLPPVPFSDLLSDASQIAFSLLVQVVTRAEVPSLISFPSSPLNWGIAAATLLLFAGAAGALGLGILATARSLLRPPRA